MRFKISLIIALIVLLSPKPGYADCEIQSISFPSLSADGQTVYFSAWGDIWSAPRDASMPARRLTDNVAYDSRPIPSPDGTQIAFLSDRFGSYDIFIMPESGGAATRLTWDSNTDYLYDWKSDGSAILSYTQRQDQFGMSAYEINLDGKKPKRLSGPDHDDHVFTSYLEEGKKLVYTRGPGDWAKKKWRGQNSYDIWTYDMVTGKHNQLTDFDGADLWPQPSPDGKTIYFVSGRDGAYNLWSYDVASEKQKQLTTFKNDGPIWPRISSDGDEIAFEVFGEAYVYSIKNKKSEKVKITFANDTKHEMVLDMTLVNNISEYAISPNGNYYAVVVYGDIFILKNPDNYEDDGKPDQDLARTYHVVETPAREMHVSWHPDSTKIIYISDRSDQYDVFTLDLITLEETRITNSRNDEWYPEFAPHGDLIAYYSGNRELRLYDTEEKKETLLHEGQLKQGPWLLGYEWSPDAKWITFVEATLDSIADVFIINIEDKKPINVSFTPDWDSSPCWSPDGKYLAYYSDYENGAEVMLLELSPEEKTYDTDLLFPDDVPADEEESEEEEIDEDDETENESESDENGDDEDEDESDESDEGDEDEDDVEPIEIDLDRIHLRAKPIVKMNADAYSPRFAPNSEYLIFVTDHDGELEWWSVNVDGDEYHKLAGADTKDYPEWSPDGSKLHFLENGRISYLEMTGSKSSGGGSLVTKNEMTIDQYNIWEQMMTDGWRHIRESFYDKNMHGVDWESVIKRYLPRVRDCGTIYEYSRLYRLMLGELNASHLSFYSTAHDREAPSEQTADLGVIIDENRIAAGWLVERVITDSPADQPGSKLYEGDVILEINGKKINSYDNPSVILRNLVGIPTKLKVRNDTRVIEAAKSGEIVTLIGEPDFEERDVVLKPTTRQAMRTLLYKDWIQANREEVTRKSNNKIGYHHIRRMYEDELDRFRKELFTENMDKDALIIDVRFNSGGHIAADVVDILRRKPAYHHQLRDAKLGSRSALTWNGPIVVLINAQSFSNAEIFGHIMRDMGLATIIGESTGGGVISTYTFTLLDGSSFTMPSWLNARLNGENMEHHGVIPDIYVHIDPEALAEGRDNQLEAAIDFLLDELKKKK